MLPSDMPVSTPFYNSAQRSKTKRKKMKRQVSLVSPTIDQFVSFCLLTEVCTIREYEVIQIIFYRFMHNKGIRSHTDNILQIYAQ